MLKSRTKKDPSCLCTKSTKRVLDTKKLTLTKAKKLRKLQYTIDSECASGVFIDGKIIEKIRVWKLLCPLNHCPGK